MALIIKKEQVDLVPCPSCGRTARVLYCIHGEHDLKIGNKDLGGAHLDLCFLCYGRIFALIRAARNNFVPVK